MVGLLKEISYRQCQTQGVEHMYVTVSVCFSESEKNCDVMLVSKLTGLEVSGDVQGMLM